MPCHNHHGRLTFGFELFWVYRRALSQRAPAPLVASAGRCHHCKTQHLLQQHRPQYCCLCLCLWFVPCQHHGPTCFVCCPASIQSDRVRKCYVASNVEYSRHMIKRTCGRRACACCFLSSPTGSGLLTCCSAPKRAAGRNQTCNKAFSSDHMPSMLSLMQHYLLGVTAARAQ
jgi:hypothetical protein